MRDTIEQSSAAMASSSSIDIPGSAGAEYIVGNEKRRSMDHEKTLGEEAKVSRLSSGHDRASVKIESDTTHRQLRPRHIQLIGIGGTIGTALYVQIGHGLINGGPGSLFLAFTIWCSFILAVTNSMAELVTYNPSKNLCLLMTFEECLTCCSFLAVHSIRRSIC